jgi:hypothetical protein
MELSCSSDYLADAKVIKFSFLNLSDGVSSTQQPVVMEYVIERSIEQITHEVEQAQSEIPKSHALLKVQTITMCETCRCFQGALVAP